ncbi:MAG: tricarballylate utilization 4Fe-4S protein TcuB [Candidatus Dormibacteraeota bacterium]|nr:tricarballylate utilization 4Fe-4S protein TcuB [Candidatus Dormibacteraeota bacterium]
MPELLDLLDKADWQFAVCNSCRYCEGYCAVFPAAEKMPAIGIAELTQLSNLCHECRACYQACMYAPPHEFGVNIPELLSDARGASYRRFAWPGWLRPALARPWGTVALAAGAGTVAALLAAVAGAGISGIGAAGSGPGAFYTVVGQWAMTGGGLVLGLVPLLVLIACFWRFWTAMGGTGRQLLDLRSYRATLVDVAGLRYLGGGGGGCYYPDAASPSRARRALHQAVVAGFVLAFASTTVAAFEQHVLGILPPYSLLSAPVLLGTAGGLLLIVGGGGLLLLRAREGEVDHTLASPASRALSVSFLGLLLWIAATGLLLLALRGTGAMGPLLILHLGAVAGLFLTVPYGKLLHAIPRFAALWRYNLSRRES